MSDSNGSSSDPPAYEEKFADFIKLCATTDKDAVVMVAMPEALGDTYDEMVESLNRLADAELRLVIVPRSQRKA